MQASVYLAFEGDRNSKQSLPECVTDTLNQSGSWNMSSFLVKSVSLTNSIDMFAVLKVFLWARPMCEP
jgi:hypothetical protein